MKNNFLSKIVIWVLILCLFVEATPVWALSKDETIYVKTNNDGSISSVTVSEHLNDNGKTWISDRSHLNNISNVNGDETYSSDGNKIVWEANGNDIYYQGTTSEDLPISMNIKYYLDGKEMSIQDMLGKKGKVEVKIFYKNNSINYVPLSNKVETLYTPFVVATTSLISNIDNKSIKVTNGKVIDNGNTSLVLSIATPGLYDSLGIDGLKDLDNVTISYDTNYFELNTIYAVATPKLLEESDLNIFNNVKTLFESIDLLQDNMNLLVDSASKINDGASKLANGTNELNSVVTSITDTYFKYRKMDISDVKEDIIKLLEENIEDIVPLLKDMIVNEVTNSINNNKEDIEKSVVEYSIKNTKEVISNEIENIISNLDFREIISNFIGNDLLNALLSDESIKELSKVFKDELNKEISEEINRTTNKVIKDSFFEVKMTDEEKIAYIQSIANKYNVSFEVAQAIIGEVQEDTINGIKENSNVISNSISTKVIDNLNNKDYINSLSFNYISNVNSRIKDIISNDSNLSEYQKELINNIASTLKRELSKDELIKKYINASEYVDGLIDTIINSTAYDVVDLYTEKIVLEVINNITNNDSNINDELSAIFSKYENNINDKLTMIDGKVSTLQSSIELLNNGANDLANGISLFNDGIKKYNIEGISKLSSIVNGDVKILELKIEALLKLSNDYKTLDDIDSDATGSSKIIFMLDAIKKEKEKQVNQERIVEKKTFWEKIKGLFK